MLLFVEVMDGANSAYIFAFTALGAHLFDQNGKQDGTVCYSMLHYAGLCLSSVLPTVWKTSSCVANFLLDFHQLMLHTKKPQLVRVEC